MQRNLDDLEVTTNVNSEQLTGVLGRSPLRSCDECGTQCAWHARTDHGKSAVSRTDVRHVKTRQLMWIAVRWAPAVALRSGPPRPTIGKWQHHRPASRSAPPYFAERRQRPADAPAAMSLYTNEATRSAPLQSNSTPCIVAGSNSVASSH